MRLEDVLDVSILRLNEKKFKAAKDKVSEDNATWVLGAGVSVPAGLPDWNTLLTKMWARLSEIDPGDNTNARIDMEAFMKARRNKLDQIKDYAKYWAKVEEACKGKSDNIFSEINVLESAEYMWNYIEDLVSRSLDKDSREKLQKEILKELVRSSLSINVGSDELRAHLTNQAVGNLAELLGISGKGTVITYNYDDILEFCLDEIAGVDEKNVSVICDCTMKESVKNDKIFIHHPHGALKIVGSRFGRESEEIVLTESSYYKLEREAYRWENSVQANALVETSCIFMGFSGDDYNFRRIIKNIGSKQKKVESKHYIFVCIDKLVTKICGKDLKGIKEERYLYNNIQFINVLYAQYSYWDNHGIIPIWTTYDELPNMIARLYS